MLARNFFRQKSNLVLLAFHPIASEPFLSHYLTQLGRNVLMKDKHAIALKILQKSLSIVRLKSVDNIFSCLSEIKVPCKKGIEKSIHPMKLKN